MKTRTGDSKRLRWKEATVRVDNNNNNKIFIQIPTDRVYKETEEV